MSTLGYGDLTPIHSLGMFLISVQTLIGLLIAFVIIARFITQLPKHRTIQEINQKIELSNLIKKLK